MPVAELFQPRKPLGSNVVQQRPHIQLLHLLETARFAARSVLCDAKAEVREELAALPITQQQVLQLQHEQQLWAVPTVCSQVVLACQIKGHQL